MLLMRLLNFKNPEVLRKGDDMHFERIEIQNFSSYFKEHSIDLACSPEKPVVIVLGGTGQGKTSIFDAINWALYGTDYERDLVRRRKRQIIDYVNETALREAESKKHGVEMSCTLYFEHNRVHYYINQALAAKPIRDSSGKLNSEQTDRTTALYEITPSGNHKRKQYDAIFLDEILPNNVKDYFLFDGDRIYNLSNPGSSQEVRDAIFRVVDLELIKNAENHLSQIATEFRRSANREAQGEELTEVSKSYQEEWDKLTTLKEEEQIYKEEEQAIKAQIGTLEGKLENLPDTSSLQGRRSELENQLIHVGDQLEEITADIRTEAATAAIRIASEPLLNLAKEIDSQRQKGLIPKKVSQKLLEDLLELNTCLCGTKFKEGDAIHKTLSDRLEAEKGKGSGQGLLELFYQLSAASDLVSDSLLDLNKKDKEHHRLWEYRRELDLAIKQIDDELDKLPQEDITALTNELRQRRIALVTNARKLQQTADRIEDCEEQIKSLKKRREELGKKQNKVRGLQLRESLAQRAVQKLEEIYELFSEESRQAVEKLTREEFHQFVSSASTYDVALSKDYELQILDSQGNRALQKVSMGQSQCLSLAFITAISRVSEKNPPLVIDMPFGRLDRDVHHQVSNRLPQIASQIILFLIPEIEWNEVTEMNLRPKASHIYNIEFDKENRESKIINI